ncbi:NADH:ubiquinone oxidoreductase [Anaerotardibacter muris]|uniref:NADH-quinone oxidoreductase subunit B family protein n=1 Tax=Anaerotardibacter muris TaxID=2941505 RepID=UPI00203E68D2|nr:NADH:ubiquinone oxidoreductase [Anaerotardibacter muris]
MTDHTCASNTEGQLPRVVVAGLASCFGCQLQITNQEQYLTDILGRFDLQYWQLASSDPMPEDFDIVIIEGAVTTEEALEQVKALREVADTVITIGACANTGGIPGIAAAGYASRASEVYDSVPEACGTMIEPCAVSDVIAVDFQVPCCPIDFYEFAQILSAALMGSNRARRSTTMCNECKRQENPCFYPQGEICLGLVTSGGCMARCPSLGRPCMGCRGLSPKANLDSARESVASYNLSVEEFDRKLSIFNQTNAVLSAKDEASDD